MAFTVTPRHSGNNGTGASPNLTTSSATPTASSLLLAFYGVENNSHETAPTLGAPSGGGLTFTLVNKIGDAVSIPWGGSNFYRVGGACYSAPVGSSPSAHTLVFDAYADSSSGYLAAAVIDITGHDAASPIVQQKTAGADGAAGNSVDGIVTLDSAPTAGNLLVIGFYAAADNGGGITAPEAGTGKTMVQQFNQNTGYGQVGIWTRVVDGTESTTITSIDLGQSVGAWTGHAVEIALDGGGGGALTGDAALAGVGTLSAAAHVGKVASAALAGVGTITASAHVTKHADAALAGVGTLTAAANASAAGINADATLSGVGDLVASAHVGTVADATLPGVGTIAAAGHVGKHPDATLPGVGVFAATATVGKHTNASLDGVGTLTATATVHVVGIATGDAALAGVGDLAATAHVGKHPGASLDGVGVITATAHVASFPTAALVGVGTITASASVHGALRTVSVYVGGAWVDKPIMYHNGTAWVQAESMKYHNGSSWVETP